MEDLSASFSGARAESNLPPSALPPEKAESSSLQQLLRSTVPRSSKMAALSAAHTSMRTLQAKANTPGTGEMPPVSSVPPSSKTSPAGKLLSVSYVLPLPKTSCTSQMPRVSSVLPSSRMQQAGTSTTAEVPRASSVLPSSTMQQHQSLAPALLHARPRITQGKAFTPSTLLALAPTETPAGIRPTATQLVSKTTILAPAKSSEVPISRHKTLYRSAVVPGRHAEVLPASTTGGTDSPTHAIPQIARPEAVPPAAWQIPANQSVALQQTRALEVKRLRTLMQQSRAALVSRWGAPGDDRRFEGATPEGAVVRAPSAEERQILAATSVREPLKAEAPAATIRITAAKELAVSRRAGTDAEGKGVFAKSVATLGESRNKLADRLPPADIKTMTRYATLPRLPPPASVDGVICPTKQIGAAAGGESSAETDEHVTEPGAPERPTVIAAAAAPSLPDAAVPSDIPTAAPAAQEKNAVKFIKHFKTVQEAPGVDAWRQQVSPAKAAVSVKAKAFIPKVVKKKTPFGKRPILKRTPLPGAAADAVAAPAGAEQLQSQMEKLGDEQAEEGSSLPFSLDTFPSQESGDSVLNLTASDFLDRLPACVSVRSVSPAIAGKRSPPLGIYRKAGEAAPAREALSQIFRSRMVDEADLLSPSSPEPSEPAIISGAEDEDFERELSPSAAAEEEEQTRELGEAESKEVAQLKEDELHVSAERETWTTWGMEDPGALTAPTQPRKREELEGRETTEVGQKRDEREEPARRGERAPATGPASEAADRRVLLRAAAKDEEEEEALSKVPAAKFEPQQARVQETIRKKLTPGKREVLQLDKRVDELASQEDYERAALTLEEEIEAPDETSGLSPALGRLRQERAALSRWVQRLRKGTRPEKSLDGLVSEGGILLRPPLHKAAETTAAEFAKIYGAASAGLTTEEEAFLDEPLRSQGHTMKDIVAKDLSMPSAAVYSLEQRIQRQIQELAQQRRHVTLLQKALTKRAAEGTDMGLSSRNRDHQEEEEVEAGTGGIVTGEEASAVTQQILEEQCVTLLQRYEEEKDHSLAYKRAWIKTQRTTQAATEKYEELKAALRTLHAAKTMREAQNEEEKEKLRDCEDELEMKMQALARSCSSNQQYEYQLLALQKRYEELRYYLQEWQEKASSFQEGLVESTSNLQEQTALLQIERHASLRLKALLREREDRIAQLEVDLRVEKDKVLLETRAGEQLRAAAAEQERLRAAAEYEIEEEKEKLATEQRKYGELRQLLDEREQQIQHLQDALEGYHASDLLAAEKRDKVKGIAKDIVHMISDVKSRIEAAEKAIQKIEKRRQRALLLLKKAREDANLEQQGSLELLQQERNQREKQERDIAHLKQELQDFKAAEAIRSKQDADALMEVQQQLQNEKMKYEDDLQEHVQQLHEAEAAKLQMEAELEEQQEDNRHLREKLKAFTFTSQGRASTEPPPDKLLRIMQAGMPMRRNLPFKAKSTVVHIKLSNDRKTVLLSADSEGVKKQSLIKVEDIVAVEFGTASAACLARLEETGGCLKHFKKVPSVSPWRCFAVYTPRGGNVFIAPSDQAAEA